MSLSLYIGDPSAGGRFFTDLFGMEYHFFRPLFELIEDQTGKGFKQEEDTEFEVQELPVVQQIIHRYFLKVAASPVKVWHFQFAGTTETRIHTAAGPPAEPVDFRNYYRYFFELTPHLTLTELELEGQTLVFHPGVRAVTQQELLSYLRTLRDSFMEASILKQRVFLIGI